eukprot:106472-Pyramimonas_sp.AAC.1
MVRFVYPDSMSVLSSQKVIDTFQTFNLDVADNRRKGFIPVFMPFKRDIECFFNNAPWALIHRALDWLISRWKNVAGTRRMCVNRPRKVAPLCASRG